MKVFRVVLCLVIAYFQLVFAESAEKAPNVLIFFVDDMGYGDLGCQGNKTVDTPNIDKLASEGVRFTQWISGDSICTPSRGALLTGRLPVRIGLSNGVYYKRVFQPLSPGGLPFEEHTIAEALKERGYSTHLSGKWHLGVGKDKQFLPQGHGFDNHYGMGITNVKSCMPGEKVYAQDHLFLFIWANTKAVWLTMLGIAAASYVFGLIRLKCFGISTVFIMLIFVLAVVIVDRTTLVSQHMCILYHNKEIVQQPVVLHNLTQRITDDASRFISRSVTSESPFFLLLSYHKMHTALFSNKEFKLVDEEKHPEFKYVSNLRELDWSVGFIVDQLKELGEYEDTIIWFTSDNGPFLERANEGGSKSFYTVDENGNEVVKTLRGGKATIWEGGYRVPGIGVYKKLFPVGQVTDEAVSTMDIFPTSIRIIDDILPKNGSYTYTTEHPHTIMDGKDITDLITSLGTENPVPSPHVEMFHYCGETLSAVRLDGRFKAYVYTPVYSEEELETCSVQTSCQCQGSFVTYHDPPLMFDLKNDIEEKHPLKPSNFKDYDVVLKRAQDAFAHHQNLKRSFPDRKNQMEYLQQISLLPEVCCNFPSCKCDTDPYSTLL